MACPFVVDKNLGEKLKLDPNDLPRTNADGEPIVDLTQEQKYLFDARGWLLVPGVLEADEVDRMRRQAEQVRDNPESLTEHERNYISGPLEKLTDHPVVVGFLNEFLAHPHLSSPDCYGFRMEGTGLRSPSAEPDKQGKFSPHNGSGFFRFAVDSHHYQCVPGKAFSGLTRVVWELAPVKHGQGGTLLATGSHKAAYTAPESIQDRTSEVWDTYACPAGSVLFFTEALAHSKAHDPQAGAIPLLGVEFALQKVGLNLSYLGGMARVQRRPPAGAQNRRFWGRGAQAFRMATSSAFFMMLW